MKLYLQNIVKDIYFENLLAKWQGFNFERFSKDKTLFDFQQDAPKNACVAYDFMTMFFVFNDIYSK
jgi:hypothetical protein